MFKKLILVSFLLPNLALVIAAQESEAIMVVYETITTGLRQSPATGNTITIFTPNLYISQVNFDNHVVNTLVSLQNLKELKEVTIYIKSTDTIPESTHKTDLSNNTPVSDQYWIIDRTKIKSINGYECYYFTRNVMADETNYEGWATTAIQMPNGKYFMELPVPDFPLEMTVILDSDIFMHFRAKTIDLNPPQKIIKSYENLYQWGSENDLNTKLMKELESMITFQKDTTNLLNFKDYGKWIVAAHRQVPMRIKMTQADINANLEITKHSSVDESQLMKQLYSGLEKVCHETEDIFLETITTSMNGFPSVQKIYRTCTTAEQKKVG